MTDPALQQGSNPSIIWRAVAEQLQQELPRESYLTWFKPLEPTTFDGTTLTLQAPSRFYVGWIESHYLKALTQAVAVALGEGVELAFTIDSKSSGSRGRSRQKAQYSELAAEPEPVSMNYQSTQLRAHYTFDNFIEGDCNRFARAASLTLSDKPGKNRFNPLMIYGGSGLGKTHLLQAIGNHIFTNKRAGRVLYVTSEKFTSDFIEAIRNGGTDRFSRNYRNVDVLLLDDVQFFLTKEKTQEEFFHTFNALHHAGKQLVFSSDRPPRELKRFDQRLKSRLQWGLVSELQAPELETRLLILKSRAQKDNIELPDDVAQFIATHITDNIRSLQGVLIRLLAESSLLGKKVSVDLAREVIRNLDNSKDNTLSVGQIQDTVAVEFSIPSDLLRSKTRKREVAIARKVAMFMTTEYTNLTLKAIGLHFGGRDHATVIHARESINEELKENQELGVKVDKIRRALELLSL